MNAQKAFRLLAILALLSMFLNQGPASAETGGSDLLKILSQQADGELITDTHAETGLVSFLAAPEGYVLAYSPGIDFLTTPETSARSFLDTYGSLFGLQNPKQELVLLRETTALNNNQTVRFQQVEQGIPVFGGQLIVQMDPAKNVLSAAGEILPEQPSSFTPAITDEQAAEEALAAVAKIYAADPAILQASEPSLAIYNPALLGGPGPRLTALVWQMEVTPVDLQPIRELVLVDAQRGFVALHFNQIDTVRNRLTYDAGNDYYIPGTLVCGESNPSCAGGDTDEVAAHTYAGDTYDFYKNNYGRDSLNGFGMSLVSTTHFGLDYGNAFWNGQQMVYGDGYGFARADDVVGHEMTHGVTQYESNLFYYYQSGAINESLSDLWGEFIDLSNGKGNDSPSVRWLLGEDITNLGAIRSMSNPPAFSHPDRMSSSYYNCDLGETDNGGVHYNSGVNNKAVTLMTDGGTFNGYTMSGLGISKVGHIYYYAQTNLLTSGADYKDLYNSLQASCSALTGWYGITSGDCTNMKKALDAVEMSVQPAGCGAPDVAMCDANGWPAYVFSDNLENPGNSKWNKGTLGGPQIWYYPQNPNPYFDMTYTTSGVYNFFGDDPVSASNAYIVMKNDVTIPSSLPAYMHFKHAFGFEDIGANYYDGGILEYSLDQGTTWTNATNLFSFGGYNGRINYSGNPLNGQYAFVAESNGYRSSRLNLSALAGQSVRFRFHIATDSSGGDWGWFIDDVNIYTCQYPISILSITILNPTRMLEP